MQCSKASRGARMGNSSWRDTFLHKNPVNFLYRGVNISTYKKIVLPVVRVAVQVAEFPDGGVGPPAAVILFGFAFQFQEMGTQIVTVGQIPHDVEEPIAHPAWEIGHLIRRALLPTFPPKKRINQFSI